MKINGIDVEKLKSLIQYGFDPRIISWELDIPMESIRKLQEELELPKRAKKEKPSKKKKQKKEEATIQEETVSAPRDYAKVIEYYKKEAYESPSGNSGNARNLLAFAYWKAGEVESARAELMRLVDETGNYTAYRQLIHLEKEQGNLEDAKLWAYEAMEKFPDNEQLLRQAEFIEEVEDLER